MFPNDLNYQFPSGVYLLFGVLVLLILFWSLNLYRQGALKRFAPEKTLKAIMIPRSPYYYWAKVAAACLTWLLATLALMQPRGNGHYPLGSPLEAAKTPTGEEKEAVIKRKAHDIIFLIDASASMSVQDTRTQLSRLEYAKEIVDETIRNLLGESVALYAFTSDTTKLSPPTMDYLFVRLMLRQLRINEGDLAGTDITKALKEMRSEYFTEVTPKMKTLIILTDGGDTELENLKGQERESQIQSITNLLDNPEAYQLRVFTIGMGTSQGKTIAGVEYQGKPVVSSLDEELLKRLSRVGRGEYYFANNWTALDLSNALVEKIGEEEPRFDEFKIKSRAAVTRGEEDLIYDLFFQTPLGIAILLLSFILFFPDTRFRKGGA